MNGIIIDSAKAHGQKVAVNPIERHYEDVGEAPYIKYICPVCNAAGNRGVSLPHGERRCPLCGVRLNWERRPETGDRVVITETGPWAAGLGKGSICTVGSRGEEPDELWFWLHEEGTASSVFVPAHAFSVLEPEENLTGKQGLEAWN